MLTTSFLLHQQVQVVQPLRHLTTTLVVECIFVVIHLAVAPRLVSHLGVGVTQIAAN